MDAAMEDSLPAMELDEKLIKSFTEITSTTTGIAKFFLEAYRGDLDRAVSTFKRNKAAFAAALNVQNPSEKQPLRFPGCEYLNPRNNVSDSSPPPPSNHSPSRSRERSRSPPPPSPSRYPLRSTIAENIRTFADNDSDKSQELYAGGTKSGMIVQDTRKAKDDVDDKAKDSAVNSQRSTSRSFFAGTTRKLSGETVSAEPEVVTYTVTIWRNGFTVDDSPLKTLDDPNDVSFLESVQRLESPRELSPDGKTRLLVKLIRRQEEDFTEPPKPNTPFQGVGRTLDESSSLSFLVSEPPVLPMKLVVDPAAPITSIQIRLADGTRLVTKFNTHHTVRDIQGFVDASTPGGHRVYELLVMGSPPKPLLDLDQTVDEAAIANTVLIQKYLSLF